MKLRPKIGFIAGLVIGSLLAGGVVWATIPTSGTKVFYGCRKVTNGSLRLIDYQAGARCVVGERVVTWNQAGQRGPTGLTGPKGPAGPGGFLLKNNLGVTLGTVASTSFTASRAEWVVWDGAKFQIYNDLGSHPLTASPNGILPFFTSLDCTGDVFILPIVDPRTIAYQLPIYFMFGTQMVATQLGPEAMTTTHSFYSGVGCVTVDTTQTVIPVSMFPAPQTARPLSVVPA